MFRKVVCLIIVLSFLFVTGMASGWAEDIKGKVKPADALKEKSSYSITCPPGWKHKPGNPLACVPAKPAPIKCPNIQGVTFKYYERLTCQSGPGGTECKGCEIGCFPSKPLPLIHKPEIICPSGWQHKPGSSLVCVPAKPAPIKCPEVPGKTYKYYENLKCYSSPTIGGTECKGCEIGCVEEVPPPR